MKKILLAGLIYFVCYLSFSKNSITDNYANIAYAKYKDSLTLAEVMLSKINFFLEAPSEKKFLEVKKSWLKARTVYQQTEVFRFGNAIVDEWEGKVNAWPLDEGLIDYVDNTNYYPSENDFSNFNVVANSVLKVEGNEIDARVINANLLGDVLHEIGGNEANVATGYHAIEFLLWGQDLNGTKAGAGKRGFEDYSLKACSNTNCDRRRDYLKAAAELLVSDLEEIVAKWGVNGEARNDILKENEMEALKRILIGMGSLSYGELAGERMKLGLMLNDPEEEHDCFSDNTHNSHFYNVIGIKNVYLGNYKNIDGKTIKGDSLSSKVALIDKDLDLAVRNAINQTINRMQKIVDSAEGGITYDMLIAEGNDDGNRLIQDAVDALVVQSRSIEEVAKSLNISNLQIEGSDSLDNPDAVFN
ncbi:MAG: peptidase [Rickettsiales bacterium]|nr:peptidase [Rickettsiales bacterium]